MSFIHESTSNDGEGFNTCGKEGDHVLPLKKRKFLLVKGKRSGDIIP